MVSRQARILILCKTYPSPSGKHTETSCVAGMHEDGQFIRLFPVPFRLIGDERQFKKWQWITARIEKATNDHRIESHRVFVDTIERDGDPISPKNGWQERRTHIEKNTIFSDFAALAESRIDRGSTIGILRPSKIIGLDITPTERPQWTPEEKQKLLRHQQQSGLFDETDAKNIATLKKLPFDFHYRYRCHSNGNYTEYRHKIADWEVGALFWNCRKKYGAKWEAPFRKKIETDLPATDLMLLMGTIHRFPDQWLIISLIYPPRPPSVPTPQGTLFDLLGAPPGDSSA